MPASKDYRYTMPASKDYRYTMPASQEYRYTMPAAKEYKYTMQHTGTYQEHPVNITISSIKASSADCDGCDQSVLAGCDPRGPNMLISPCNATVCATTPWGCGGDCTAGNLVVNENGQGMWVSKPSSKVDGDWLDLDLGDYYSVTKFEIWSGVDSGRFPQTMTILTGGSIDDGSTDGGIGCVDKSLTVAADSGNWKIVAGPFITGSITSLVGCASAQSIAGFGAQTDSDKCEVPVSGVMGQHVRIWFRGTMGNVDNGNDDRTELRAIKVFGSQLSRYA